MTTGRPPKPTALRILGGKAGHSRPLNDREPQPPAGRVEIPDWLLDLDGQTPVAGGTLRELRRRARELRIAKYSRLSREALIEAIIAAAPGPRVLAWRHLEQLLTGMKVLTRADEIALGLIVDAMTEYVAARQVVVEAGAYYETYGQSGLQIKPHPAVKQASDAWRRVYTGLTQFGATPAARTKVKAELEPPADPAEAFFDDVTG